MITAYFVSGFSGVIAFCLGMLFGSHVLFTLGIIYLFTSFYYLGVNA